MHKGCTSLSPSLEEGASRRIAASRPGSCRLVMGMTSREITALAEFLVGFKFDAGCDVF